MPVSIVRFLVCLGAVFLILAALVAGGIVTGWSWLLPAGLATLAVAWLVSLLPVAGSTTVIERQP